MATGQGTNRRKYGWERKVLSERIPTAAAEWRQHWPLVGAAMIGYSLASVHAASTGVMMAPIEQELGWSRTEIYSGASLVSFITMGVATFIGIAIDRVGPRRIAIASVALLCGAIAFMSTTGDSLWGWWARWALIGVAIAAMPTVWVTPIASRFNVSRGLAVAVALSGSGIGTFLVPIVANALVEEHGWRGAYVGLGLIWALVVLPLVLLFFRDPKDKPAASSPTASKPQGPNALVGLTAREGFRSPTYYKLLFAGAGGTIGGVAIVLNLVPVLTFTGLTRTTAATVAGLVGVSTIAGRVLGGWLTDRLSAKWIAALSTFLGSALPVALLLIPGSVVAAVAGVLIYGLAGGAKIGALAYLASRHLGSRAFGTLYGAINAAIALAVGLAPLAANFIYDMTQSYAPVMWAATPILAVSALLYVSLGSYPDFSSTGSTPAR